MQTSKLVTLAFDELYEITTELVSDSHYHSTKLEITDPKGLINRISIKDMEIQTQSADYGFNADVHAAIQIALRKAKVLPKLNEGVTRLKLEVRTDVNHPEIRHALNEHLSIAPIEISFVNKKDEIIPVGKALAIQGFTPTDGNKDAFNIIIEHPTDQSAVNLLSTMPIIIIETKSIGKKITSIEDILIYNNVTHREFIKDIKEGR